MIQIEGDIMEKKLKGKLTREEERLFATWGRGPGVKAVCERGVG